MPIVVKDFREVEIVQDVRKVNSIKTIGTFLKVNVDYVKNKR